MRLHPGIVEVAKRLGSLIDDGMRVMRAYMTDELYIVMPGEHPRVYFFSPTVSTDQLPDLEQDIRDLHERTMAFEQKWGAK